MNYEGREAINPSLRTCHSYEDACYSDYVKTDITNKVKKFPETLKNWTSFKQLLFSLFQWDDVVPAGSWSKSCISKSDAQEWWFAHDITDQCVEVGPENDSYLKVNNINACFMCLSKL